MQNKYEYRVSWSEEDQVYIGRVAEFPSLAAHGESPEKALAEIEFVVASVVEDMQEHGESVPEPLSVRQYSGQVDIHMLVMQTGHNAGNVMERAGSITTPQPRQGFGAGRAKIVRTVINVMK